MSITTEWYNPEKTIIHNIHNGGWTWAEFHKAMSDIETMIETVPDHVMIIVNIRNSSVMPVGVPSQFNKLRAFWAHPKIDGAVIVGMNRIIQIFFDIFIQVSPQLKQLLQSAQTLEEAESLIKKRQNTAELVK